MLGREEVAVATGVTAPPGGRADENPRASTWPLGTCGSFSDPRPALPWPRHQLHRIPLSAPSLHPQQTVGAAYRAVGRTGAHFVPAGIPAHLEDAAGASVAVDQASTLQSKANASRTWAEGLSSAPNTPSWQSSNTQEGKGLPLHAAGCGNSPSHCLPRAGNCLGGARLPCPAKG